MTPKWLVIGIGSALVLVLGASTACTRLGLCCQAQADVKAYAKTLQGLNEDMRETLHKQIGRAHV